MTPSHQAFYGSTIEKDLILMTISPTEVFADWQVNRLLEMVNENWMNSNEERLSHFGYTWKVVMPEVSLKIYMDFLNLTRNESLRLIKICPPDDDVEDYNLFEF